MEPQGDYERAQARVEEKLAFYRFLAVYVGVNLLLLVINLLTFRQYLWCKWPFLGMSVALVILGLKTFVFTGNRLGDVKERMIEREMEKQKRRRS
jgi:hypothetical protein